MIEKRPIAACDRCGEPARWQLMRRGPEPEPTFPAFYVPGPGTVFSSTGQFTVGQSWPQPTQTWTWRTLTLTSTSAPSAPIGVVPIATACDDCVDDMMTLRALGTQEG